MRSNQKSSNHTFMPIATFFRDRSFFYATWSASRGQHFQARGHSFFTLRADPKPANNISIFPAVNWLTSGFVYATLSPN